MRTFADITIDELIRQKSKMNMTSSTSCMHCCAQCFRKPAKK
ncbi:hypothetical protein ACTNDS_08990 [Blautia sp. HCP3S3_C12]